MFEVYRRSEGGSNNFRPLMQACLTLPKAIAAPSLHTFGITMVEHSKHGYGVNINCYIRPQVQILFPQEGLHGWQIGCLNQHDKTVDTA